MAARLADLLAGLSRFADLGFGLRAGEALRGCVLAAALARSLDVDEDDVRAAFYTSLLHHVGCTSYAHETARLVGDELAMSVAAGRTDHARPRDMFATFLPTLTHGRPPLARARMTLSTLTRGQRLGRDWTTAACEVGRDAARRLALPDEVQRGVFHVYELWQGGGSPDGLAGDDIPVAARIARAAGITTLFDSIGGRELALDAVRRRAGGMLDPGMVDHLATHADALLAEVDTADAQTLLASEPAPVVWVPDPALPQVAQVFADLADLKSPYTHGHSRGVATLARDAAERCRLGAATISEVEVAGLLHDVGRVAISDTVWEKLGPLTIDDREQVRLHPYHSERILAASPRLAPVGMLVGRHHERLDGTGYHRGSRSDELSPAARVLAAADAYQAMTQARPHRAALQPERAERELLTEATAGRLDPDAVDAVLAAAGHTARPARREPPAGLTDREVEVLGLVAAGYSNPQVAAQLTISRRTAEHHVQHIYAKIGVSSRAAAALFAMEHDLL